MTTATGPPCELFGGDAEGLVEGTGLRQPPDQGSLPQTPGHTVIIDLWAGGLGCWLGSLGSQSSGMNSGAATPAPATAYGLAPDGPGP